MPAQMSSLDISKVFPLIRIALAEDGADHDVTTLSLVDPSKKIYASIVSRINCVVAGTNVAMAVFAETDPNLKVKIDFADGMRAAPGDTLMRISGAAAPILAGERTALNFMQRMTGIATATAEFVKAVEGTKCKILDTRKTIPGFRFIDKYSVKCGGGTNHRIGLSDMVLIKDNHRKLWLSGTDFRLDYAVKTARSMFPAVPIEVEVENMAELKSAIGGKPDWIMLDNMSCSDMRDAVEAINDRCKVEASGGITMANIRDVAKTGVDAISLGCLTHSVKAADLSLEFDAI